MHPAVIRPIRSCTSRWHSRVHLPLPSPSLPPNIEFFDGATGGQRFTLPSSHSTSLSPGLSISSPRNRHRSRHRCGRVTEREREKDAYAHTRIRLRIEDTLEAIFLQPTFALSRVSLFPSFSDTHDGDKGNRVAYFRPSSSAAARAQSSPLSRTGDTTYS